MFPRERSLVQRYQDQPFVLLGVNTDSSRERLRAVQEKERLTWRSWWDGPPPFLCPADFVQPLDESALRSRREGRTGLITRQWAIQALPTLYLLDHRSIIRYKRQGVPPPQEVEHKIEELLNEVPASAS
jgi:hypothetical protein